jgi:hypothetical protein
MSRIAVARRIARRIAPLAAMLAAAASSTRAQSAIYGAGLQAWTGCWSAEQRLTPAGVRALVCISPTANVNVAQVAAIDGNVVALETIDATGRPIALDAAGCIGTRRATWSRDSRRLFLRTTGVCQGVPLAMSAIFSISALGEWLDVEGFGARGGTTVRVARYRDVGVPVGLPVDVASSIQANELARESTRAAFGAPVRLDDVIDALSLVDSNVVAAWILERAQRFDVTQGELAQLDLSGFPSRVADALTAIADSNAMLARATDDSSYYDQGSVEDQQASESSFADYYLPPWYWGADFSRFPSHRAGGFGANSFSQRFPRYPHFYHPPFVITGGSAGGARIAQARDGTASDGRDRGGQGPRDNAQDDPRYMPSTPDRPSAGGTVRLGRPRR